LIGKLDDKNCSLVTNPISITVPNLAKNIPLSNNHKENKVHKQPLGQLGNDDTKIALQVSKILVIGVSKSKRGIRNAFHKISRFSNQ
jgi:hypothetical protein